MWARWIFILICLFLVIGRLFYPDLEVDIISVWFIGIASVIFFLPQLNKIIPLVKKMKLGNTEFEFKEKLGNLGKQMEEIQIERSEEPIGKVNGGIESEIEKIIQTSLTNPEAALLLLSARLEKAIRSRLLEEKLLAEDKHLNLPSMIGIGARNGLFPQRYFNLVLEFWKLRNRVAHGHNLDVSKGELISLITVGTEILRMVPLQEKKKQ